MKRMASIVAAILTIASLATARSAFGADIATVVSNATDVTVNSDTLASGEALYVYTETGTEFNFTLANQAKAWILVVGGGGAGGYSQTTANLKNSYGAGGGGGGGGLIETNGISLSAGTYTITVGAGGAAPANGKNGGDGNPSVFAGFTGSGILFNALGGGGGAASGNAGSPGGSGGGGSYYTGEKGGGTALNDGAQGNAGGAGGAKGGGAGGGGAGGAGNPITSDFHAGQGGVGIISAIEGPSVIYAAGGGGGSNDYMGSGGAGDGTGNGAGATAATAGANGRGGGGGGGNGRSGCRPGAKGGSGIVIIRVTKIYGEITPPVARDFEYTGSSQNIWPEYDPSDCDLSVAPESLKQTAVGTYTFTATPKDGSCWKGTGGSTDPTNITWHIVKSSNSLTLVQDGWVEGSPVDPVVSYKVTDDPSEPTFTYSTAEDGEYTTAMPTTPGDYWIKASIAETDNYYGATAGPVSFRILGTSESPIASLGFYVPITFPAYVGPGEATVTFTPAVANYQTKDNSTSALCLCSANGRIYPQSIEWTAGDVAELTVEFDDLSPDKTFYLCWGLVEGESEPTIPTTSKTGTAISPNTDTVVRDTSKTLQNYIKDLAMPSWRVGETPSTPEYTYKIGTPVVKYIDSSSNESSECPTEPGTYTLSVSIPEETGTDNYGPYSGVAAQTVTFRILGETKTPLKDGSLKYFSTVTAPSAVEAGKVSFTVPATHDWVASYNDGTDVRFCDIDGNVYPSALSAWNVDGSATFAVEVPAMTEGDKFYMCWGETVEKTAPEVEAPSGSSIPTSFIVGDTVSDTSLTLKNWIRDLEMRGFRLGDSPTVPTCTNKIGDVIYQYSAYQSFPSGQTMIYDTANPPAAGTYYMRAVVAPSSENGYEGAVSENTPVTLKFRVLGETESPLDALAWFAPVTATGTLDSPASVTVKLPNTFDYKTIYNDGSDIRFCDADGNVLPSTAAGAWATDGTAKFNVQLPEFSSSYKFYVCWGPVVGQTIPDTSTPVAATVSPTITVGDAVRDEAKQPLVNHWVVNPWFPSAWATNDTPTFTAGVPAYGDFKLLCRNVATGEETIGETLPATAGDFELVAYVDAGDYWAGMTNDPFEVSVSKHDSSISLTREFGAEGRVLLMNADVTPGAEVYNQGYADNDPTYSTFWEHLDYDYDSIKGTAFQRLNLSNETAGILWTSNKERRLWTLKHCRQGNFFRKDDSYNIASATAYNYLPWDSPNARDIDSHASTTHTRHGAGQIIMQNATNAVVYSSCFEDGIGTIYFDAVNGGRITSTVRPEDFQLKISYATDCITSLGEVVDIAPTDEYVRDFDATEPEPGTITTNANWQVVKNVVPIKITNGVIDTAFAQTDTVTLDVDVGGSDKNFYRLRTKLDITKPVRFKIERASVSGNAVDFLTSYILLDNIIVSYPAMRASITTYGDYDPTRQGRAVLGQRMALSEAFPSPSSDGLLGRGKVSFLTNGGVENPDTDAFIVSARFNYRWRYLNQGFYHDGKFSTSDDGEFASVRLSPTLDYASTRPLDLPGRTGDIEYWYELVLGAPYYEYVDYSGLDVGVGDYTEEITSVEAHAGASFVNLPSGGTNWFVRIREGASPYEKVVLTIDETIGGSTESKKSEDLAMDLIGDHQWRGFVVVTNKTERDISFSVKAMNRQTDGATEFDESESNVDVFLSRTAEPVDISERPYSGVLVKYGEETGFYAKLHYLTNVASYVEFQFNDETGAIAISHADWQDFNMWSSSHRDDADKFYSSAHETNSTTVATKRYPARQPDGSTTNVVSQFIETPLTANAWHEEFKLTGTQQLSPDGYWMNKTFASARTPKGWLAEHGLWVAQAWGMTNSTDFAVQLEGRGNGSVQFIDKNPIPGGLDTVSFNARLAQFSEFSDISWSWESIMSKNYTIAALGCFDESAKFEGFSGEASVSLVAGYVPGVGCYEYRITIYNVDADEGTNPNVAKRRYATCRHAIYKWTVSGNSYVATPLVDFIGTDGEENSWWWNAENKNRTEIVKRLPLGKDGTSYSGMYMSFSNEVNKVIITAGVSAGYEGEGTTTQESNKSSGGGAFTFDSEKKFLQIGCTDTSPLARFGTFGALSRNCPARILYPRVYTNSTVALPTEGVETVPGGSRWKGSVPLLASADGAELQRSNFDNWAHQPGRMEAFQGSTSTQPWGIQAVTNISQTVRIQTLPVGSEDEWTDLDAFEVNSFSFGIPYVKSLRSSVPCWVRFANGGDSSDSVRTDIVIDNITLTQWCGQDGSVTNASSANGYYYDFYHTAAWISNKVEKVGRKSVTNRVALLAPRRSPSGTHPVGIRTPYLHGLGAIFFKFCDCGEDAVLSLEYWKGNYTYLNLRSAEAAGSDGWQNLTNWTFTAGESGMRSFYLGERAPSNGVFRIVIPQDNVKKAWSNDTYDVNWGAVTITDIWCLDEPELDSHSWWGWNFLTTGWNDGKGNGYAALEDSGDGSSGVLNNTLAVDTLVTGDQSDYKGNSPFIQSPTLSNRNIGEVSFRAKRDPKYSSGCVTVWGAKKGDYQSGESWTAVTNIVVDSPFFERFTVKCAEEEQFAAIRLGIAGVDGIDDRFAMKPAKAAEYPSPLPRVVLDEIVIRERVKPEVGFRLDYARPFRLGLSESTAILDIASRDQQPLLGEQFGFQAEVEVTGLADEVDLGHAPEVYLSFYPSSEPWGYANWKDAPGAVTNVLLAAAEGTNLVYRSTGSVPLSLAGPYNAEDALGYRIVQYYFTVKYWDKGGDSHETQISQSQWDMPSWYRGFDDPNEVEGAKFSPFTLLDTVSPGRAWFNEVNFSDENCNNAKQFVEICFPAGYDMTGWRIYRYNAWGDLAFMGALGLTGSIPSTKEASGGDPNFAFLTLTSANKAHPDADAYWSSGSGQLSASDCYGFQLVRPSGVIEHQIVVQGLLGDGRYSREKTGTNVVATLTSLYPKWGEWSFVGVDTNAAIKSTGVFQNAGAAPEDWNDTMDMTPGRINANQEIPSDWFLPPGGTNVWLTLSTAGNLVWIVDAGECVAAKTVIVSQDVETNIVFATAPWHALSSLLRDSSSEVVSAAVRSGGIGGTNMWTYAFKESAKNSATLVASAGPDSDVLLRGKLDPADPYTPAVMNWLLGGTSDGKPFAGTEISTNSFFRGLSAGGLREYLPLKDRYWLDMDPTVDCDLYGGMGGPENLDKPVPTPPVVTEVRRSPDVTGVWPVKVTNRVVTVSMFISNKVSNVVRAPNRLQGLGGEKSDIVGTKNWTSETFKITMSLIKPEGAPGIDVRSNYWPMASFVFGPGSFNAQDSDHPFAARIEVLDPMSPSSPAYGYGWWEYPGSTYGYRWDLSHGMYYRDPSMLQSTNTWSKTWEVTNDY